MAKIHWADNGVGYVDTTTLGWTGQHVYVRLTDSRWQFTAVWLDANDVRRR
ncbi:MAG TPA: hypothetical protein VK585_02720 [Jiangellaceae bacterium]|nr:hypothetical protein [Jiangellaceae bacterium]